MIGLIHVSIDLLLDLPECEFRFVLRCLQSQLRLRSSSREKMGRYEDMRKYRFQCAIGIFRICAEIARKNNISTEDAFASELLFGKHKVTVMEHMVMQAPKLEYAAAKRLWVSKVSKRLKEVRNKLHARFKVTLDALEKEEEPGANAGAQNLSAPSHSAEEASIVDDGAGSGKTSLRRSTRNRKATGSVPEAVADVVPRNKMTKRKRKATNVSGDEESQELPSKRRRRAARRNVLQEAASVLRRMSKELRMFLRNEDILESSTSEDEPDVVVEEESGFTGDDKERENRRKFENNNP